ncbi:MAG: hypothetical protein AAFR33_10180 [Pseudomonadota bacterium]
MSKLTEYLRRPMSETTDILVSGVIGGAAWAVFQIVPNILPFQAGLETGIAGAIGAAFYLRARNNLTKTPPSLPE